MFYHPVTPNVYRKLHKICRNVLIVRHLTKMQNITPIITSFMKSYKFSRLSGNCFVALLWQHSGKIYGWTSHWFGQVTKDSWSGQCLSLSPEVYPCLLQLWTRGAIDIHILPEVDTTRIQLHRHFFTEQSLIIIIKKYPFSTAWVPQTVPSALQIHENQDQKSTVHQHIPEGRPWGFLLSTPCLESQGCQFDPTLLFFCLILLLFLSYPFGSVLLAFLSLNFHCPKGMLFYVAHLFCLFERLDEYFSWW